MRNRIVETLYRLRDGTTEVLRRITRGYRQNAETAESTSSRVEAANRRQRSSLSGVLAKIGRLRFAYFAVAGAVFGMVRAVGGWVSAANQQEQAEARLEQAIQNGRGATDEQIDSLKDLARERQRVTRFGDEATISAQAQLATFRLTAEQIAELTPRVQDLAEGNRRMGRTNVDLERTAQLVGRAMTGNIGALSRYGIQLTETERQTLRFGSETEKLAAIAGAIDRSFGGMAEALTPFELASRRAENNVGDFREQLGAFITQSTAVTDAVDAIGNAFSRMSDRISEGGGTINRVLGGIVASLRVLGNTADIIFQAIMAGANRLQRGIMTTGRNIAESLARVTFGSAREALTSFVEDVDRELEGLEAKQEARWDRMGQAVDGFVKSGEDLNDILFRANETQDEANKLSREAQEEALAQRRAEEEKHAALERTRETLEQLGIDALEVETGISNAARETTAALAQMAQDGQASLGVLAAAGRQATESLNAAELEHFRTELQKLEQAGKISADQLAALTLHLEELSDEGDKASDTMRGLEAAIAEVGSQHELGNVAAEIERLGQAGDLSAGQIEQLTGAIQRKRQALDEDTAASQRNRDSQQEFQQATKGGADELARQGEEAEETSGRMVRLGGTIELTAEAQERLNQRVNEWSGIGTASWINHYRRALEEAKKMTDEAREAEERRNREIERAERINDDYTRSLERLRRQHQMTGQTGVNSVEDLARANRELQFEIMRVRGEEEELAELRERERRKELQLQRRAAIEAGDRDRLNLIEEQLKLLDTLAREERRRERQGSADREREAKTRKEAAQAEERAARLGSASAGKREIEVTIKAEGGQPGGPAMSEADLAKLRQGLTREVLDEIRRDQRRGL
jgi:hypothetical protein